MVLELDTGRHASLLLKEVDTRQCASKDAGPKGGVDLVVVPHRLEKQTSANKDAGPRKTIY